MRISSLNSLVSLIFILCSCRAEDTFVVDDVKKPQKFEIDMGLFRNFDPTIGLAFSGELDGKAYVYLSGGESKTILRPSKVGDIVWLGEGRNNFTTFKSAGSKNVFLTYVPYGARTGSITIRVKK